MQIPPQITIRDMEHSDALEAHIRDHVEDVYVDAFDAAKRQLEDYVRKMRGDVKTHQPRMRSEAGDEGPNV